MNVINLFEIRNLNLTPEEIASAVSRFNDGLKKLMFKKDRDFITAKVSKYNNTEVFIQYWYYSKKLEIKRVYAFINTLTHTLEIYGSLKKKKVLDMLANVFPDALFYPLVLTPEQIVILDREHSLKTKEIETDKIVFLPKIRLLNGKKYFVELKENRIKVSSTKVFQFRPRFELRQLVFMICSIAGLVKKEVLI